MDMLLIVAWLATAKCQLSCAAGIVTNFERESGPHLDPAASSRMGAGLAGWAGKRRVRMMLTLGPRWRAGRDQLEYMVAEARGLSVRGRELREGERSLWDAMIAERNPIYAAQTFFSGFEWPDRQPPARTEHRAREIYRQIAITAITQP